MAYRHQTSGKVLAQTVCSNVSGINVTIRAGRGRAFRAGHSKKWRFCKKKPQMIANHIQSTQHQVGAEVGEFIQYPHLLFRPARLCLSLAVPVLLPLFFMPVRLLLIYPAFVLSWYLACALIFATEVAMRPPWYKKGLRMKEQPPYWHDSIRNPKEDLHVDYEHVHFVSPVDDKTLRAWFISPDSSSHAPASANMVVFVHGTGRDRRMFLRHIRHFLQRGYPCLLFDLSEHGHGDSVSQHVSRGSFFGAREQYDIIAAVEFLKHHKDAKKIAVVGTSCGASSSIFAASLRPDLVVGVFAENPFSQANGLLRHHMDMLMKSFLSPNSHQTVRHLLFWLAGKFFMFRMSCYWQSYGAIDAVSQLARSLLVLHSSADNTVSYEQGRTIHENFHRPTYNDKNLASFCTFSDAAHGALYDKDAMLWSTEVLLFVDRAFGNNPLSFNTICLQQSHLH